MKQKITATLIWILLLGFFSFLFVNTKNNPAAKNKENEKLKFNLPAKLPFKLEIADAGQPLSTEEIKNFTVKITGFWKQINYFKWVLRVSHGVDASTGLPDYAIWWNDVEAIKKGDLVTYQHSNSGGGHNVLIPTSQLLAQAINGYLLTGDKDMAKVVEQYCKGITATMKGMLWDKNDKVLYLMARNIIANNHSYKIEGTKKVAIDYSLWRNTQTNWNTHRIHFPHNPYWGDIYLHNMRSKDDVPHIFLAAGYLPLVITYGKDKKVVAAATETYKYLQGFAKDIVDSNYHIRTKDDKGQPYIPKEDLASFVDYEGVSPTAECNAKISSAYLGYGDKRGLDCKYGDGGLYEPMATRNHYYNYAIIHGFHQSAILLALINNDKDVAYNLLLGLVQRAQKLFTAKGHKPNQLKPQWKPDLAVFLLKSAAIGLPLTSEQARLIISEYEKALVHYQNFKNWDLWDKSIAEGTYSPNGGYIPDNPGLIAIEEMAVFLEYCNSPFRNPATKIVVDCEIVKDPARWGKG